MLEPTQPRSETLQKNSASSPQAGNQARARNEILRALWGNPMFRLSLSSNELFHSNTLQYFAEWISSDREVHGTSASRLESEGQIGEAELQSSDTPLEPTAITKEAASALYRLLSDSPQAPNWLYDSYSVAREWKNMDLVVFGSLRKTNEKHPLFALEIKVKSFPTNEQLDRYLAELHGHGVKEECQSDCLEKPPLFLLTGMGASGIRDKVKVVDFSTVAERMSATTAQKTNDHSIFFRSYQQLCSDLHRLFASLENSLNIDLNWQEALAIGEQLTPFRLHPIWWKLWADYLKRQCTPPPDSPRTNYLHTYSDFTNSGVAGICWRWPKFDPDHKTHDTLEVGVQIEGNSLRLFLSVRAEGLGSASEARKKVEGALIKLYANGVFAQYPATNYPDTLKKTDALPAGAGIGLPEIFVQDFHPSPRKDSSGRIKYCLNGYANGQNHGFADLRLQIKSETTIAHVADFVKAVLTEDAFSSPATRGSCGDPILLQVVKKFESSASKSDWLKAPTFASPCQP